MEDFHCLHALDELDVLGELVWELGELEEELEGLYYARELEIFVLDFLREMLLLVLELADLGWLRLDLNLGGLVAPQVLELHGVVLLGVCLGITQPFWTVSLSDTFATSRFENLSCGTVSFCVSAI